MPSQVQICNRALGFLGAKARITALTEDTKSARLCNLMWDETVDAVLRLHPWNCASERASLAQLATAPPWGWDHQYQLPTDPYCLRVLRMKNETAEWVVEGRKLLTNEDPADAKILYVKRITDPNEFDPLLVDVVAARLAADIAYGLTGSSEQQAAMFALFQDKLSDAQVADSQEGSTMLMDYEGSWLADRL